MSINNNIYEPKLPVPRQSPPPSYELKQDVTGKELPKRGPQVLTNHKNKSVRVPYPPKQKCKACCGRGFVGTSTVDDSIILCRRCYPV